MAKLPFIVEPKAKPVLVRIGNDDIGIFEIERRGYLSVAEKTFVDGFTSSSDSLRNIVRLSGDISNTTKLSREDAYKALMNVMGGNIQTKTEKDISVKFSTQIADLTAGMAEMQSKRLLAIATVLIQSRVSSEWTLDDTLDLDPELLDQLGDLYELEESKTKPEAQTADEDVKEILKK